MAASSAASLASNTNFCALNEPNRNGSIDESRELQLENTIEQFTHALDLQRRGDHAAALSELRQLAQLPLVQERLDAVADVQGSPIHALQFAIHKNLAAALTNVETGKHAFHQALSHLRKARQIDPSDYGCCEALARLALQIKDKETAYSSLKACVRLAPLHRDRVSALERLARLLFDAGEFSECLTVLKQISQKDLSEQMHAIQNTIIVELLDGDPMLASLEPNIDPSALIRIQLCRAAQKHIPTVSRSVAKHPPPTDTEAYTHLRLERGCTWVGFMDSVRSVLQRMMSHSSFSDDAKDFEQTSDPFEHNKQRLIAAPWRITFIDNSNLANMDASAFSGEASKQEDNLETDQEDTQSHGDAGENEPSPKRSRRSRQKPGDETASASVGKNTRSGKSLLESSIKELNNVTPQEIRLAYAPNFEIVDQEQILPLNLKQDLLAFMTKTRSRKGKIEVRINQLPVTQVDQTSAETIEREDKPDHVFADPALVERFVESLPRPQLSVFELLLRIITDSVVGNAQTGMPGCMRCSWPSALFGRFLRVVQIYELVGVSVIDSLLILNSPEMTQQNILLAFAELLFESQQPHATEQFSIQDQEDDDCSFAINNSVLDVSVTGILTRVLADVRRLTNKAGDPVLRIRLSWLEARLIHASDPTSNLTKILEPCIQALKRMDQPSITANGQHLLKTAGRGPSACISIDSVQSLSTIASAYRLLRAAEAAASAQKHQQVVEALLPIFAKEAVLSPENHCDSIHENAREHLFKHSPRSKRLLFMKYLQQSLDALGRIDSHPNLLLVLIREYLHAIENKIDGHERQLEDLPDLLSCSSRYLERQHPHQIILPKSTTVKLSPQLVAFLTELAPIAVLLTRVAWQMMVFVSANPLGHKQSHKKNEPRNRIGRFVVRAWVLYFHVDRLWHGTTALKALPKAHLHHEHETIHPDKEASATNALGDSNVTLPVAEGDAQQPISIDSSDPDIQMNDQNRAASESDAKQPDLIDLDAAENSGKQNKQIPDDAIVETLTDSSEEDDEAMHDIVEAMSWVHEQLGEIFLCGSDGYNYLKFMLSIISRLSYEDHHENVNRCFACMYGIVIKLDRDSIYEHECESMPFDREAAKEVFTLFSPYILDWISSKSFRLITNDIRDCVETISKAIGDVSRANTRAQHNSRLLTKYFERDIDPDVLNPVSPSHIGFLDLKDDEKVTFSDRMVNYVTGGVIWAQYNARLLNSNRAEEAVEELELATKSLKRHLSLAPLHIDAWILLGQCFHALSNTLLHWSAIKIVQSKSDIAQYQRLAFHSFSRAVKLIGATPKLDASEKPSPDTLLVLWRSMASLCYSIAAKPMSGTALSSSVYRAKETWKARFADSSRNPGMHQPADTSVLIAFQPSKALVAMTHHMYGVSLFCARRVLVLEETSVPTHIIAASACRKLGKTTDAIAHLIRACWCVVEDPSIKETQERALDPLIKLIDTLAVLYRKGALKPQSVMTALQKLPPTIISPDLLCNDVLSGQASTDQLQDAANPDPHGIYAVLVRVLTAIKTMDRKKWHHKPFYRHAWIMYHVFQNAETAKSELLNLFQLRTHSKSLKTIWKTELESPGKHFVYIHKYSLFLITVARVTSDVSLLRQLHRRLCKTDEICLDKAALVERISESLCLIGIGQLATDADSVRRMRLLVQQPSIISVLEEAESLLSGDGSFDTSSSGDNNMIESMYESIIFAADLRRERLCTNPIAASLDSFIVAAYSHICWKAFVHIQTQRGINVFADVAFVQGNMAGAPPQGSENDDVNNTILRRALKLKR